jgi:hypothetical protein
MSQTTTTLDIDNKDDAKMLIEIFIDHEKTMKIEITKGATGYQGAFTVQDPAATAPAGG